MPKKILKYGETFRPARAFEISRKNMNPIGEKTAEVYDGGKNYYIDYSWLQFASSVYKISSDLTDYVFQIGPAMVADIPNRNYDAFTFLELSTFKPLLGRVTYSTFKGKPTFASHVNKDNEQAKGVIFDAYFAKKGKYWVIYTLKGWDRTKDRKLVGDIMAGRNGTSMGAIVGYTVCSYCNVKMTHVFCEHIGEERRGKGKIIDGTLIYEQNAMINFFEESSVEAPAYFSCYSGVIS